MVPQKKVEISEFKIGAAAQLSSSSMDAIPRLSTIVINGLEEFVRSTKKASVDSKELSSIIGILIVLV